MTQVTIIQGQAPRLTLHTSLPHIDLYSRIAESIVATRHLRVVYEDLLGEGPGAWHSRERYPTSQVNCMIWLQLVLAEAYGWFGGQSGKQLAMDCLRYYGGHVGFSMRKHYLEQWLAFDPGPLQPISLHKLCSTRRHSSVIEPKVFLARREFELPLYQMERTAFETEYVSMSQMRSLSELLSPGFHVMFAVPTKFFFEMFADRCGPLGLVHCTFLEVGGWRSTEPALTLSRCTVHHASVLLGEIVSEPLEVYLEKSGHIHQGYIVCELNPEWVARVRGWNTEAIGLVSREQQFEANGFRPYMGF